MQHSNFSKELSNHAKYGVNSHRAEFKLCIYSHKSNLVQKNPTFFKKLYVLLYHLVAKKGIELIATSLPKLI